MMDLNAAIAVLEEHLDALQSCDNQIKLLDKKLDDLGSEILRADLHDNQSRKLRLSARLSVLEGVQQAYQQYSEIKKYQIQRTIRYIRLLRAGLPVGPEDIPPVISSMTSSPFTEGLSTNQDRTARVWSMVDRDLYRGD